jgi:hypothetical protein
MGIISGGRIIPSGSQVGTRTKPYAVEGVPTDANIGLTETAANGMIAVNVLTNFIYERRAGAWVRMDTV